MTQTNNLPLSVKGIYLRWRGKSTSMLRTVGLQFCATKCYITARSGVTSTFSDRRVNNCGHGNIQWLQGKDLFELAINLVLQPVMDETMQLPLLLGVVTCRI